MKLLITTLCLALGSGAAVVHAESASTATPDATRSIVTAQQKEQMKEIVEAGGSKQEARDQVLSEEQRAQLAKNPKKPKSGSAKKGETIMGKLGLSEEQKAKISKIRADGGTRKDVRGVLTAEQAAQYDELRRERKANKDKSHKGKKDKEGKKDKKESKYKARDE